MVDLHTHFSIAWVVGGIRYHVSSLLFVWKMSWIIQHPFECIVVKNDVKCPICVCLNMLVSFVKTDVQQFFWQPNFFGHINSSDQMFLVTQILVIELSDWKFLVVNFWSPNYHPNFLGQCLEMFWGASQKLLFIQLTLVQSPPMMQQLNLFWLLPKNI